ncbi:MAG: ribbon-helix-helix protein, CopG family [Gemmatimonadota bacterium]|nr:ribbon-helix-helix protein, CopG family [Gemmatimonadota bacterium]
MHVHAIYALGMRTTVELSDDMRAKLLEAAARRGERGFSSVVEEALRRYFDEDEDRSRRVDEAQAVLGSLEDTEADELRESIRRLRERWR